MTFSVIVIIFCVVCLIVNSGLIGAGQLVSCNTLVISDELYDGNNNATIPWAGVTNFDDYIQNATDGLVNAQPTLSFYFSNNSQNYKDVTNTTTGSLYTLSQSYTCGNSSNNVVCPFADNTNCPSPLTAVFNDQFCNQTFTGSAQNLISGEMTNNSTNWRDSIENLANSLANAPITSDSINQTITQV